MAQESLTARTVSIASTAVIMLMAGATHAAETLPHGPGTPPHSEADRHTDTESYTEQGLIPGDWVTQGRVEHVRAEQIEVDIGNPQPLFLPLLPAREKRFDVRPGDTLEIVLNDHYAIVDYHLTTDQDRRHTILRGRLAEPPTVGMDKATVKTRDGEQSFIVASRARSKISAIPLETDAIFLVDETGMMVDAQILSTEGERQSAENQKPPITGAHRRVSAIYLGVPKAEHAKVRTVRDGKERILPFRPPLGKIDRLKKDQEVTLLVDGEGYITEIATPDVAVR